METYTGQLVTRKVEDLLKGEHFQFQDGLYRRTEHGFKHTDGVVDDTELTFETEVEVVDPVRWRIRRLRKQFKPEADWRNVEEE